MLKNNTSTEPINTYSSEKYAIYLRKSRADLEMEALGEGETLARHRASLEALAAKHHDPKTPLSLSCFSQTQTQSKNLFLGKIHSHVFAQLKHHSRTDYLFFQGRNN